VQWTSLVMMIEVLMVRVVMVDEFAGQMLKVRKGR
jgi:hypothetical protein